MIGFVKFRPKMRWIIDLSFWLKKNLTSTFQIWKWQMCCTIASTDLYFDIYDLWMVFAKTELGDPGSALPALQLMPPCTSEKNRTYDWVFSPQLIQEILPPPIFPPDGHLLHGKHWPLSLFANWLYVSAQREKYLLSLLGPLKGMSAATKLRK